MTTRILYIYIYISYVLVHEKITTLNLEKLERKKCSRVRGKMGIF